MTEAGCQNADVEVVVAGLTQLLGQLFAPLYDAVVNPGDLFWSLRALSDVSKLLTWVGLN